MFLDYNRLDLYELEHGSISPSPLANADLAYHAFPPAVHNHDFFF